MNKNITKIHLIRATAAFLLCVGVASCSQDDFDIKRGESLPLNKYKLSFTATVDGMDTRSAGKDSWTDGDEIGIRIGSDEATGRYMLNSDGSIKKFVNSVAWTSDAPATVRAWYPFLAKGEGKSAVISDQSKGFADYDFLVAVAEDQTYQDQVNLNFKHQMAKASCNLIQDESLTDDEFKTVKLTYFGYTEATFTEKGLTGGNHGTIIPTSDYEALFVPQEMSGKDFIKIDIKVTVNGKMVDKTFIYKFAAGDLKANTHYKYNVTVKRDRIEVASLSVSWTDTDTNHPAKPAPFFIKIENMPEELQEDGAVQFSDNVIPYFSGPEDYLIVKGNSFYFTYKVTDKNLIKGFNISKGNETDKIARDVEDGNYVFRCFVLSEEITLTYVDYVEEGDYYYKDGSWANPKLGIEKEVIGIVFKKGPGGVRDFTDDETNYDGKLKTIHGYAVALQDATKVPVKWGDGNQVTDVPYAKNKNDYENTPYTGYNYTKNIEKWGVNHDYTAAKTAIEYGVEAPANSSGWYLPTAAQLLDAYNLNGADRTELFEKAGGKDFITDKSTGRYWTCILLNNSSGVIFSFYDGLPASKTRTSGMSSNMSYVRAVLTF